MSRRKRIGECRRGRNRSDLQVVHSLVIFFGENYHIDQNLSKLDELREEIFTNRLSRRSVLKRGIALGLSAPVIAALLAAGGGDDDDEDPTATEGSESGQEATATDEPEEEEPTEEPEEEEGQRQPKNQPAAWLGAAVVYSSSTGRQLQF